MITAVTKRQLMSKWGFIKTLHEVVHDTAPLTHLSLLSFKSLSNNAAQWNSKLQRMHCRVQKGNENQIPAELVFNNILVTQSPKFKSCLSWPQCNCGWHMAQVFQPAFLSFVSSTERVLCLISLIPVPVWHLPHHTLFQDKWDKSKEQWDIWIILLWLKKYCNKLILYVIINSCLLQCFFWKEMELLSASTRKFLFPHSQ